MTLDEVRAIVAVQPAFPLDRLRIAAPVLRRSALPVQGEVFEVDVVLRQVEVRPVLLAPPVCRTLLVWPLVAELHPMFGQEVGDQHLLIAPDQVAVEVSALDAPDILLVLGHGLELEGGPVWG